MIVAGDLKAARVAAERRRMTRAVMGIGAVIAVLLGLLAGYLAVANRTSALVGLVALVVPVIVWRRPAIGVFALGCAGLVIEQYYVGASSSDFTDHIPWFVSLSDGFKLSGVYVNPAEIGIILVLSILVLQAGVAHRFAWPAGFVGISYVAVLLAVGFGAAHGLAAGGSSTMVLWEIRPFLYVFLLYFLALQLKPSFSILQAFYWCVVLGTAFKAAQGILLLVPIQTSGVTRPEYLLSHDDAFFFGADVFLVASLWLFGRRGRLRTVGTLLLPMVMVVNMANGRRTAWLILGAGLLVVFVMVWVRLPERRTMLTKLGVASAVVLAAYLPIFWNSSGTLAQPARAVRSAIDPSVRDQLSDAYRVAENANLTLAIRNSTPLGVGFGVPINYVIPITDLSRTDPFIKYITHDGILYIWMRTGWLGILAWLAWISALLIAASQLLRARDIRLACFAAFSAACVVSYVIEGYYDLGLFWFRMAFFMGLLIGLTQMAIRLQTGAAAAEPVEQRRAA